MIECFLRLLKLHDQVHVAFRLRLVANEGAEEAQPRNTKGADGGRLY